MKAIWFSLLAFRWSVSWQMLSSSRTGSRMIRRTLLSIGLGYSGVVIADWREQKARQGSAMHRWT